MIVACVSRLLKGAEKNYTITEKEVLAAIWSMEKLEHMLIGRKFVLETDHKAIEQIKSKIDFGTPRIQRWLNRLERFLFQVKYIKGEDLIAADALSRSMNTENEAKALEKDYKKEIMKSHIEKGHRKDIVSNIKRELDTGFSIIFRQFSNQFRHFIFLN